jgi:hypothetical protein
MLWATQVNLVFADANKTMVLYPLAGVGGGGWGGGWGGGHKTTSSCGNKTKVLCPRRGEGVNHCGGEGRGLPLCLAETTPWFCVRWDILVYLNVVLWAARFTRRTPVCARRMPKYCRGLQPAKSARRAHGSARRTHVVRKQCAKISLCT